MMDRLPNPSPGRMSAKGRRTGRIAPLVLSFLLASCAAGGNVARTAPPPAPAAPGVVQITLLQMNDVYELTPVSGGREGGLARVASLRKELLAENPNTITLLAGDLFSPSALGTAKVDGERLAGRQMVAVMNTLGLDFITFGNHEFDIPERSFRDRLKESGFTWIASNVFDRQGNRFPGVPDHRIVPIRGAGGETVRLGIFGLTIDSNRAGYVTYADPLDTARAQVKALRPRVDILVALTHLSAGQDVALAQSVPGIDLILGGHEHENMQFRRGAAYVPICKADANARTVYIHRLRYDTASRKLSIRSELRRVTGEIPEDAETAAAVRRWQETGFAAFRKQGFHPERIVAAIPVPLDGLEASVRNRSTALTRLIAEAMKASTPDIELAFYNSGSIRIDDLLPPGPLTEYDLIRILPFGGRICTAEIPGDLLARVLDQGTANRGQGGFLQTAGVEHTDAGWTVNGNRLEEGRIYKAAVNDFLLSGREQNLGFFSEQAPGVRADCPAGRDIRFVFRDHLKTVYGSRTP
ncbi:MAG: 5'-nucleotidase C-terminal domain-containing protein [Deltaproteobacteria bacterium]